VIKAEEFNFDKLPADRSRSPRVEYRYVTWTGELKEMASTTSDPLSVHSPLRDIINPQFHQNILPAEDYLKASLGLKLDKGVVYPFHLPLLILIHADDQICRLALTGAGCPLGPLHCPLRHTNPSLQNFQPPKQPPSHPRERERLATVCKHWLRGLCKKGDACEFLHEYNLRRMPECWWYAKYGYCSAGDECLYAHPKERKVECPDYNRGFCKLGEFDSGIVSKPF